jgi:hypothetical protein
VIDPDSLPSGGLTGLDPRVAEMVRAQIEVFCMPDGEQFDEAADRRDELARNLSDEQRRLGVMIGYTIVRLCTTKYRNRRTTV